MSESFHPTVSLDALICNPVSNLLHTQEEIAKYCPGGYHPVSVGDTFKGGRYRVAHKLGWGNFSTVWLVRDQQLDKWVALKIATAKSTRSSREASTLHTLQEKCGSDYIPKLLDDFTHVGPNGVHQCLISELCGPSTNTVVTDYTEGGDRLDPEIILTVSRQLLDAIASAHEAGFAHGDVSGSNIVFTASKLAYLPEDRLFEVIGTPEVTSLSRIDGAPLSPSLPKQLVGEVEWVEWIDEDEEDIRLLDWGEAFVHNAAPTELAQLADYRVPETFFTGEFDHTVDLWLAGCTIYSLVFAAHPFHNWGNPEFIAQMVNVVEQLPTEWEATWQVIHESSGQLFETCNAAQSRLERQFHDKVHEPELVPLLAVIQGLMRFLPSNRMSAAEARALL